VIGLELPLAVAVQGALIGAMYGLLAVGLILVYRSNRVINFAHGELGAFGAAIFALLVVRWHLPYWLVLPVALLVSGMIGGVAEIGIVRRLRAAPSVLTVVATLGLGQFLLLAAATVNPDAATGTTYPRPPWMPTFDIGSFRVGPAYTAMLVLAPLSVVSLSLFLRRGRTGRALRAAAANPDAARLDGVRAARMSTLAWVLAGALAALTAILVSPTRGFVAASSFGPSLLLRALVVAVLARMDRLGVAFVAGIGLGIVEQQILWNTTTAGAVELALFVTVMVTLPWLRPLGVRRSETISWLTIRPWRPTPRAIRETTIGRWLAPATTIIATSLAVGIVLLMTNATAYTVVAIAAFAVIGLSIAVTTGLLGELSLGMFAIGGVGAIVSIPIATATGNFALAFASAAVAGGFATLAIGVPALRAPGLMLTVTTLSFALAAQLWGFRQPWAFGSGETPGQPVIGSLRIDTGRSYALFAIVVFVIALTVAWNLRRSGVARRYRAVRDNEAAARAFALPATRIKAHGLMLGGSFAGLGGALYAHSLPSVSAQSFPVGSSIDVVAMSALGGVGLMSGTLLGGLYVIGVPRFVPLDNAGLAATALGWLLLVLYVPSGVVRFVAPVRRRVLVVAARRAGIDPAVLDAGAPGHSDGDTGPRRLPLARREPSVVGGGGPLLAARGLHKRYGGVVAVDGVDLTAPSGSIVGLIGANGAGKTTLFEIIGGFTPADAGTVEVAGIDVTRRRPEQRASDGLVRSFQDAALFPSLTVAETVALALEHRLPTSTVGAMLGFDRHRRERERSADELITSMGLTAWQDIAVGELSTGTRRITELACLVALNPLVLLLDEPAAGLAQREVEALGVLLRRFRDEAGMTMVVIEHDIPFVMAISDEVVAMGSGRVIATGDPAVVRSHPEVIASYLGDDRTAVERSETSPG
jgi:ABC-type branched-subunit amino acid transport system ATPase component/branched-subunit amino acid ABC-type transport system permease component